MATYVETTTRPDEHGLEWAEHGLEWAEDDEAEVLTRAETAECTCPEFCERDHDNE